MDKQSSQHDLTNSQNCDINERGLNTIEVDENAAIFTKSIHRLVGLLFKYANIQKYREITIGDISIEQVQNHALTILGMSHDFWIEQLDAGRSVGEILSGSVYIALIMSRIDIRKAM
ncbi:MAG: hypothetical protein EZS28_033510, partial [Streblomastix strix]